MLKQTKAVTYLEQAANDPNVRLAPNQYPLPSCLYQMLVKYVSSQ